MNRTITVIDSRKYRSATTYCIAEFRDGSCSVTQVGRPQRPEFNRDFLSIIDAIDVVTNVIADRSQS